MQENPNALRMLLDVLYQTAETITSIVGLTPLQFAMVIGGLFGLMVLWQVYCSIRGKTSFTLEDNS